MNEKGIRKRFVEHRSEILWNVLFIMILVLYILVIVVLLEIVYFENTLIDLVELINREYAK